MFTAGKQPSRGFARLYFQQLILKFNKSKMAAIETRKVFFFITSVLSVVVT